MGTYSDLKTRYGAACVRLLEARLRVTDKWRTIQEPGKVWDMNDMQIVQEEEMQLTYAVREAEQRCALLKQEIIVARSQGLHIEGSK